MELIQINRTKTTLRRQLTFLIRREFKNKYLRHRRLIYYLIGLTIAVLALTILTDASKWIALKAVLLMLTTVCWIAAIIFLIVIFFHFVRRVKYRDSSIETYFKSKADEFFSFDDNALTFVTDKYKSEIQWSYYKYYAEDKSSVYLICGRSLYDAIYFSPDDIGLDNFERLKQMARLKLVPLDA